MEDNHNSSYGWERDLNAKKFQKIENLMHELEHRFKQRISYSKQAHALISFSMKASPTSIFKKKIIKMTNMAEIYINNIRLVNMYFDF